ncbi:MAG: hypothetical protein FJX46_09035 [Alphaproteobacteria bacterium]|nr:hypothetical protein [Alphaproteobacteria bacterium]
MERFSKEEISQHRGWLQKWRAPGRMLEYVDNLMDRLGSENLFTQAGVGFVREAWIAGKFGAGRGVEAVRLVADQWPDFEICQNATVQKFEATEADLPGRRRGAQYRAAARKAAQGASLVKHVSLGNSIEWADQVSAILKSACGRKLESEYAGRTGLVIYLNSISVYGIRQREIEDCFQSATRCAKDAFQEIWILCSDTAYLVWNDGQAASKQLRL